MFQCRNYVSESAVQCAIGIRNNYCIQLKTFLASPLTMARDKDHLAYANVRKGQQGRHLAVYTY